MAWWWEVFWAAVVLGLAWCLVEAWLRKKE